MNQEYKIDFIEPVVEYLRTSNDDHSPVLSIYYNSYLTLSDSENTEHYFNLKKLLIEHSSSLEKKEAVNLFDSAMNYCIRKVNQGTSAFNNEYFDLTEKGLKDNILLENGELTQWRFNNIVAIALRLGKADWSENFIKNYSKYIPGEQRENVAAFSLSRVYWYQKKYNEALQLLRNVEFTDLGYSLISKTLIMYIYYEKREFDALYSFMETFKVFISRHKEIPIQRKKIYKNLIVFITNLTRIQQGDKKAIEKLRTEITLSADLPRKDWLLEKLDELSKK